VVLIIAFVSLDGVAWGGRKQAEFEQILAAREQISSAGAGCVYRRSAGQAGGIRRENFRVMAATWRMSLCIRSSAVGWA
jgi:hypothetical protein